MVMAKVGEGARRSESRRGLERMASQSKGGLVHR